MYRMRRNLENSVVDELGSMASEDTRWTPEEVQADAENFGMDADDFIERYLEPCKWYAVQETEEDAWDCGSYDYDEAVRMLKEKGHGLIAVIDDNEPGGFCDDVIWYEDIFDREPTAPERRTEMRNIENREMSLAGEMDEMIALGWTLETFDNDFDGCESDSWTANDKETCRRIFTELWELREQEA